jgi:hypothetical protein
MAIFISYSNRDGDAVRQLKAHLEAFGHAVWSDQDLKGGDAWWRAILEQIRTCTVFILALSDHALESEPCQAELGYARALGVPVLPVQIGPVKSLRMLDIADLQIVDYRGGTASDGIKLAAAVNRCTAQQRPLPDPLPPPPPIPYEYLGRIAAILKHPHVTAAEQASVIVELREAHNRVAEDSVRVEIADLFRRLRARTDVTLRSASEVDEILAALPGPEPDPPPVPPVAPARLLHPNALSLTAITFGSLAVLLYPVLLGPAALVLALTALARREPYARFAAAAALGGTALGPVVGILVVGM